MHFKRCQPLPKETPFPFFRGPLFLGPLVFFFFFFFLALQRLARLKCNLEPNCGAYLGVSILQPHACTQRLDFESFAGRGQMLDGRVLGASQVEYKPFGKLAAVAAPEAVNVPVDTSPTVVKFPALAVLLMVSVLPVILSRPTLAAPLMLSELPDTAPIDDSVAPATVPVAVSAAQETAPKASTPVVNTSVQFTLLHSSWSQPTLPCVSPSSVAKPVSPPAGPSRRPTLEGRGPDPCCTGIEPPKAPKCSFVTPPGGTEKSRRAVLRHPRGRAEEGAGDAHIVVVGRADVHHQVGGRAQPVPAAEGVASPRRQRVSACPARLPCGSLPTARLLVRRCSSQQRGRDGAGSLHVLRRSGSVVSQQSVHL